VTRRKAVRRTAVPESRLTRFLTLGVMTGEVVAGVIAERLRSRGATDGRALIPLSARTAVRLAERLAHLRGAAMKLGQLLSLEGADLLPPEVAQALAILRADAHTMPLDQLRRVLGREWGHGWERRFAEFDYEPIAAASIGQVHRARTTDGRDLALKVQYPGVARSIDSDVNNVAALLRLARLLPMDFDIGGMVAEAKRQLHEEADYLAEARHLARFRRLVADEPRLLVPKVHADLTTVRILAMDFVAGEPLDVLTAPDVRRSERDAAGRLLERLMLRELFEFRLMQTDPNFANYLYDRATQRIVLLDFGAVSAFPAKLVEQYRRITAAIVAGDRGRVRVLATEIGYLSPDDGEDVARAAVDIILLVCEPLRHRGAYDFGASDLPTRARELGLDLAFRHGLLRAPPPETLFLHRKLAGAYLLCARMGARVNVRALVEPYLNEAEN
jgi:predicted unusual protein kinase regulating ubiquinone biosynthesis (AarF/ABC1/UbiB family)